MERCELRRKRVAQQEQERSAKYQRCRVAAAAATAPARPALAELPVVTNQMPLARPFVPKLQVPPPCPVIEEEGSDLSSERTIATARTAVDMIQEPDTSDVPQTELTGSPSPDLEFKGMPFARPPMVPKLRLFEEESSGVHG